MDYLTLLEAHTGHYAPLYHATNFLAAIKIIEDDALRADKGGRESRRLHDVMDTTDRHGFVSLTRSLSFAQSWRKADVIFVLDQEKLRQRHRVRPFDYHDYADAVSPKDTQKYRRTEAEEYVIDSIIPLSRYLTQVMIKRAAVQRIRDIICRDTILLTIDDTKPQTGDNLRPKKVRYADDDPAVLEKHPEWAMRQLVLKHPLRTYF